MSTTVEAVYEDGILKPASPLPLREGARVMVTIRCSSDEHEDAERKAWLAVSEESLMKTWDNSDDNIFNDLLDK